MLYDYLEKGENIMGKNGTIRRMIVTVLGVIIVSIGLTICLEGKTGVDPYTALIQALSDITGISMTFAVPGVNIILIIIMLFVDRSTIGFGTLVNMFGVGFLIDTFSALYEKLFYFQPGIVTMLVHLAIGLVFFTLGVSLYITSDMGVCPYDGIAPALHKRFPAKSYRFIRVLQDIITMVIALLLGGPVALGTIIMAFFIGFMINFWNDLVSKKIVGITKEKENFTEKQQA